MNTLSDLVTYTSSHHWTGPSGRKRTAIATRIATLLGPDFKLSRITQRTSDKVREHLAVNTITGQPISEGSLRHHLGVWSKLVEVARSHGAKIPDLDLRRPKTNAGRMEVFTRAEEAAFMDALIPAARSARWRRKDMSLPKITLAQVEQEFFRFGWWFKFMLATGLRPGESFRVSPSHILDRDPGPEGQVRKALHIPETKTKEPRTIPLTKWAVEALEAVSPFGCWQDYDEQVVRFRYWTHIVNIAQIRTSLTPYNLRHTYATRALEAGVPIDQVSQMMGHTNLEMTKRYVHRSEKSAFEVLESVGQ